MITIKDIKNQKIWQNFFNQNDLGTFLQTWQWAEFQDNLGYQTLKLGIIENKKLIAIALAIKIKSKRGNFLFIPHGPIFKKELLNKIIVIKLIIKNLINYLVNFYKDKDLSFIRIVSSSFSISISRRLNFLDIVLISKLLLSSSPINAADLTRSLIASVSFAGSANIPCFSK